MTETRTLNKELAQRVLDQVLFHPELHDQNTWAESIPERLRTAPITAALLEECGTRACIAGWTCILDEGTEVQIDEGGYPYLEDKTFAEHATELLGLTTQQAHEIFYETSSMAAAGKLHALLEEE